MKFKDRLFRAAAALFGGSASTAAATAINTVARQQAASTMVKAVLGQAGAALPAVAMSLLLDQMANRPLGSSGSAFVKTVTDLGQQIRKGVLAAFG